MNYWAYVPLTESAIILQQSNWDLALNNTGQNVAGVWPVYDGSDRLAGWIISSHVTWPTHLTLLLLQGDATVASSSLLAVPFAR